MFPLKFIVIIIPLIFSSVSIAYTANDSTTVGRYLTVENKPSLAQRDLLLQTVQVRFPQSVQMISDALSHVLRYSGYSLVAENQQSAALKNTLQKPLPAIDRNFGPMTLKDALITLAGPAFTLETDTLNRTINFHVKPVFAKKHVEAQ